MNNLITRNGRYFVAGDHESTHRMVNTFSHPRSVGLRKEESVICGVQWYASFGEYTNPNPSTSPSSALRYLQYYGPDAGKIPAEAALNSLIAYGMSED